MPSFKSFDYGLTYINLDRVEMFTGTDDVEFPNRSYIHILGREKPISLRIPLSELLVRLEIPLASSAIPESVRRDAWLEFKRQRSERECQELREWEQSARELQHAEDATRDEPERKSVRSERRVAKNIPNAAASRTAPE